MNIQEEQDRRLSNIEGSVKIINSEMGDVKIEVAKISTDLKWIKKFFWIVAGASVSSLIVGLIQLLLK